MAELLSDKIIVELLNCATALDGDRTPTPAVLQRCDDCRRNLHWVTPRVGGWVAALDCPQCGRFYYVEGRNDQQPNWMQPGPTALALDFSGKPTGDSLPTATMLQQLVGAGRQICERRRHIRFPVKRSIVCVPIGDDACPTAEAIKATLVNVSASGAALEIGGEFDAPYALLDFAELLRPGTQLLGVVRWKRKRLDSTLFGCRFLLGPDGRLPFAQ